MSMRQMVDKSVVDFIERFKKVGSRYSVKLPKVEYVCSHDVWEYASPVERKIRAQKYGDLSQLASKTNLIEPFIHDKELRRANKGRGSH